MQVVCYNGINISLIYFTSDQNFTFLAKNIFAQSEHLIKIEVFLLFKLYIFFLDFIKKFNELLH